MKKSEKSNYSPAWIFIAGFLFILISMGKVKGVNDVSYPKTLVYYMQQADSLMKSESYEDAIVILDTALALANENNLTLQQAIISNKIGRYLSLAGRDEASKKHFLKAIELSGKFSDSLLLAEAYNNMGIAYEYTGQADSAVYFYKKSLVLRELLEDINGMAGSYRNIAQVLRVLRQLDDANVFCQKAYELIPQMTDYKTIANIYNETAYLHELQGKLDSAKIMYQNLIDISSENNFYRGTSVGYTNLANVYEQEERFTEALQFKIKGLKIDREFRDTYGMMTSYVAISNCYYRMKEYSVALSYLDSATLICDTTWANDLLGIEMAKYQNYRAVGDYWAALTHFEDASVLKDTLFDNQRRQYIAEILTKYEVEKKEQQIAELDKVNQIKSQQVKIFGLIITILLFALVAGGAIVWLIIKNRNHKIHQMSLELKNYVLHLKDFHISHLNEHLDSEIIVRKLMDDFDLTQREAEVMDLLARGCHNSEIAGKLFVSNNTIKYHIKNIYIKLDVKSRVQALQKTMLTF